MTELVGLGTDRGAVLWAVSAAITIFWVGQNLFRKSPVTIPTFAVVWYFFLPIVLQYPFTFSPLNALATGAEAYRRYTDHIDSVLFISLLGMAAFVVGRFVAAQTRGSFAPFNFVALGFRTWSSVAILSLSTLFILSLFCVLAWAGLLEVGGIRDRGLSRPELRPVFNMVQALLPLVIALSLTKSAEQPRPLVILLALTNLTLGLMTGTRYVLVGGVMLFVLSRLTYRSLVTGISPGRIFRATPLAVLLLLLALYMGDVRRQQYNPTITISRTGLELVYGNNLSDLRDFAWVKSFWDGEFFYGKTEVAGMLGFVPTALSSFRSQWNWGVVTTGIVGLDSETHPGLRTGLFGEPYFNFGILGVLVAGIFFGYVCELLHRFTRSLVRTLPPSAARLQILAAFALLSIAAQFLNTASFFGVYVTILALACLQLVRVAAQNQTTLFRPGTGVPSSTQQANIP